MRPTKNTEFLPLSKIDLYCNDTDYFCHEINFDPSYRNECFEGCPPYILICNSYFSKVTDLYFEIPKIIAYYAKVHAGYTYEGRNKCIEEGKRLLSRDLKQLLNIK